MHIPYTHSHGLCIHCKNRSVFSTLITHTKTFSVCVLGQISVLNTLLFLQCIPPTHIAMAYAYPLHTEPWPMHIPYTQSNGLCISPTHIAMAYAYPLHTEQWPMHIPYTHSHGLCISPTHIAMAYAYPLHT